jgi:osmotically-inducible protein OsmY
MHIKSSFLTLALSVCLGLAGCAQTQTTQSTGQYLDDATITAKTKLELTKNKNVSASRVSVTTYKGIVQLSGFVKTRKEMSEAIRSARSVRGVKQIINHMEIRH